MGNRAVITTDESLNDKSIGVYLHWNGGRDLVEGFLAVCKEFGFRRPEQDSYGWARLVQVIANFLGPSGTSVGIDTLDNLDCDNGDNGVYIIKDWQIVGRKYAPEQEQQDYSLADIVAAIKKRQPVYAD